MNDIIEMIENDHYYRNECFDMTEAAKEIIQIFTELSPESQERFLMYARIAHTSEGAVKKCINRALREDVVVNENLGE